MPTQNSISCPNCGTIIDIDEIYYKQIEKKLKVQHLAKEKESQSKLTHKTDAKLWSDML